LHKGYLIIIANLQSYVYCGHYKNLDSFTVLLQNDSIMSKKKNNLPRKYHLTILGLIIAGSIILVILQT